MDDREARFTGPTKCDHCGNEVHMKEVAWHDRIRSSEVEDWFWQEGPVWRLLECPACHDVTLIRYYLDERYDPEEWDLQVLYPPMGKPITGLPPRLYREYSAALKLRHIDANAYANALGRVLEEVCIEFGERPSKSRTVYVCLNSLADKGKLPPILASIAHNLRLFRNTGDHPTLGDLTSADVPILDELCKAILWYLYAAPQLVRKAESRIEEQKSKQQKPASDTTQ